MIKFAAVVNVEQIESSPFLVINFYEKYLIDQIILPYESPKQAIDLVKELMEQYGQPVLCLTSNKDIYALTLSTPGISGMFKHYSETSETASSLKDSEDILRDLHNIEPLIPLPKLPEWRRGLFLWLEKLTETVKGRGKYDVHGI